MAEAGLQVFNNSGILQIDSTYRNMRLVEKGVLMTGPPSPVPPPQLIWGSGVLWVSLVSSVLAWRCAARCTLITYVPSAGIAVEWWRFDTSPPAPSNHGLQVFNPAGALVFDSGDVCAKVLDVFESPLGIDGGAHVYPGKRIAVVQNNAAGMLIGGPGAPGSVQRWAYTAYMPNDPTVIVDFRIVEARTQAPPFIGTRTTPHPNYMVMDVTGL
jgi:hypothetical protein